MNGYIGAERNAKLACFSRSAVKKYPDSKIDHYNLGVFLLKNSSFSDAIKEFKTVLRIRLHFFRSRDNMAATYVNWGVVRAGDS